MPQWMILVAALGGGGVIGSGGTSILSTTDQATIQRVESLEGQVLNLQQADTSIWEKKASKEYVELVIQANCK